MLAWGNLTPEDLGLMFLGVRMDLKRAHLIVLAISSTLARRGLLGDPFQDFETGLFRHVDIQENERRERVACTVGESSFAAKIFDSLLAVGHRLECVRRAGAFEGEFKEDDVVFLIFSVKDRERHDYWAALNSSQKRLPFPGSDSTPTLPPMRSAVLRTRARPMPVPS